MLDSIFVASDEATRAKMERELAETGEYTNPEYLVAEERKTPLLKLQLSS